MEEWEYVDIFQTQVRSLLDVLLKVAVSEITHIFRGSGKTLPVALGHAPAGAAPPGCRPCRLRSALERAIYPHERETSVTEAPQRDASASSLTPQPNDDDEPDDTVSAPDGVAMEAAAPLEDERVDMEWEMVQLHLFSPGNSLQQSEEHDPNLISGAATSPTTPSEEEDPRSTRREGEGAALTPCAEEENVTLPVPAGRLTEPEMEPSGSETLQKEEWLDGNKMEALNGDTVEDLIGHAMEPLDGHAMEPLNGHAMEPLIALTIESLNGHTMESEEPTDCNRDVQTAKSQGLSAVKEETDVELASKYQDEKPALRPHQAVTADKGTEASGNLVERKGEPGLIPTGSDTPVDAGIADDLPRCTSERVLSKEQGVGTKPPGERDPEKRRGPILRSDRGRRGQGPHGSPSSSPAPAPAPSFSMQLRPCSVKLDNTLRLQRLAESLHRRRRVCWDCGKTFDRKTKLRRHQRFHTGERPHVCSQCPKAFILRKNLKTHKRVHAGEKPYHCQHCHKQYTCNRKLKAHLRFHTGEKPFVCALCGKCYRLVRNLEKHMVAHKGTDEVVVDLTGKD